MDTVNGLCCFSDVHTHIPEVCTVRDGIVWMKGTSFAAFAKADCTFRRLYEWQP